MTLEEYHEIRSNNEKEQLKMRQELPEEFALIFGNYLKVKHEHIHLQNQIALVQYDMQNVKGLDYTKEHNNAPNPNKSMDVFLTLSEKLTEHETKMNYCKLYLEAMELIMKSLKNKPLVAKIKKAYCMDVYDLDAWK